MERDNKYSEMGDGEEDEDTSWAASKQSEGESSSSSSSSQRRPCQVDACATNLAHAKPYHRRHKVCEFHAKAAAVLLQGSQQRFCQQCSRFHELSEFDDSKRSCRRRLAGHNERRRKSTYDSQ